MDNQRFSEVIRQSFLIFLNGLESGKNASRSIDKLAVLHGNIAGDMASRLGNDYLIYALGFRDEGEASIRGRYFDKKVDIAVFDACRKPVAGIGVKFVMQNFSQNANNYFENMLGETANIQCADVPYFQILVLPEKMPHFRSGRKFNKWEHLTPERMKKYVVLSGDPAERYAHTPAKTLLYIVSLYPCVDQSEAASLMRNTEMIEYYKNHRVKLSSMTLPPLGNRVILNDYETFFTKVVHRIRSV